MKKRVNPSFYTLCRTAFNLTRGYQKLHAMGAKYQDISFGNLFFNPDNGDVLICDNDNVSFDNSKPGGVLGTPGFMAPEIVRGEKRPSKDTDRYSLSVLLFYLFMVNHPLEGKLEASIRCMDMAARVKLYGTDPVFIFDPNNKTNRPVKGIHDNATIYWPLYPEKLRQMFTRAFTVGLNEPSKRITEPEWMTMFSNMMSRMLQCSCGAQLFYDEDLEAKGVAHICWNCGKAVKVLLNAVDVKCIVVMGDSVKNGRSVPHAWNIVDIGADPYQLDVTWDIGAMGQSKHHIAYDYFNLTDELMNRDHKAESSLPECKSKKANYYVQRGCSFQMRHRLMAYIDKLLEQNEQMYEFRAEGRLNKVAIEKEVADHIAQSLHEQGRGSVGIKTCSNRKLGIYRIEIS